MERTTQPITKVVTWNVNGWRSAQRRGLRDWLQEEEPDIVCLQEIRLSKNQVAILQPSADAGYFSHFFGSEKHGYSGTAILSKTPPRSVTATGNRLLDAEGRTMIADFGKFLIVNAYVPNGNRNEARLQYKHRFLRALAKTVRALSLSGERVIVCGDFNTAHTALDLGQPPLRARSRSGFLASECALLDCLVQGGWRDSFRTLYPAEVGAYTWWAAHSNARVRNVGWRFDYVFVPERLSARISSVRMCSDVSISDHCPFVVELSLAVSGNGRPKKGQKVSKLSQNGAVARRQYKSCE